MRFGRFFWKLFLGNAVLVALVLGTSVWLIVAEFEWFHREQLRGYLRSQALVLRPMVDDLFDPGQSDELAALARKVGTQSSHGAVVTFLAPNGEVLGDSQSDPDSMDSLAYLAEFQQALEQGWGESIGPSTSGSRQMMFVALRVGPREDPEGVVRIAMPARAIGGGTGSARRLIWTIATIALLAAVGLALGLALLWSRRISRITRTARRLSRGRLSSRVEVTGSDEVADLARALNQMRDHLAEQLETIDGQRRMLESLLGQLSEGVVVARPDGQIVLMNPEARRLLNVQPPPTSTDGSRLLTVEQCVRQHDFQRLLLRDPGDQPSDPGASDDHAADSGFEEIRLELQGKESAVSVLARASDIILDESDMGSNGDRGRSPGSVGRLLVLTDITELTRTIKMKTDFVANASHELRTPLSAIRAAVETLISSQSGGERDSATRFLNVIDRHSSRLEELVSDLLDLSRVESGGGTFVQDVLDTDQVCADLHDRWSRDLVAKQIRWSTSIADNCGSIVASPHLLELALDNLVNNAIKFTEPGGAVSVALTRKGGVITVSVCDTGCGISPEDHQRVFERFYQVARDRSGAGPGQAERRGTGLGLSIVRHAVAAMGGRAVLRSTPGEGTEVSFTVPQPPSQLVE